MKLSGHRHEKSVNDYSCVSKEQQKNMSLILSSKSSICNAASNANNNASRTVATTALMAEAGASFIKTSMFPSASPFSGAVFHGGQFNITINAVNKSPGTCAGG